MNKLRIWIQQIYSEKFEKRITLFFQEHSTFGLIAFVFSLAGISLAIFLLGVNLFFPEWELFISFIKITITVIFFISTFSALYGLVEKNKKRVFAQIAFIFSFLPLLSLENAISITILIFFAKVIAIFVIIFAVRWLFIKHTKFTILIWIVLGVVMLFFGFKNGIIQEIIGAIVVVLTLLFFFIAFLLSPITGYDPFSLTPNERFESYLNMPVPKEVKDIKTISTSAPIGPGGFYYQLEYLASSQFFDILEQHDKFPEKNSKNIEIHLVSCDGFRIKSEKDRCYFGVIYPYFHNIIYHPQSTMVEHSVGEYFE